MQLDPPRCYEDRRRTWSVSTNLHDGQRGTLLVATALIQYSRADTMALRLGDSGRFADPKFGGPNKLVFPDLNGDGLRDWIAQVGDGEMSWNTGQGFRRDPAPFWPGVTGIGDDWHVADIDGDGDDDLLIMKGGAKPELVILRYMPNQRAGGLAANASMRVIEGIPPGQLGDFDGDGFLDVASFTDGGVLEVHRQIGGAHDLLQSVWDEDSYVPRERIEYQSSQSMQPPARPTCRYPQRCIRQGIRVVARHSRNGAGDRVYSYEDPRSDLRGRGFLGFGTVRLWDPDRGAETTTTYDHETRVRDIYPYALLPKEVVEVVPILEQEAPGEALPQRKKARARFAKRVNTYHTKLLHQDRTYFVHPESWTSWEWEQDVEIDWSRDARVHIDAPEGAPARVPVLRRRAGSYRFDDYGNVVEESVSTHGGIKHAVASAYEIREADWLVGLLRRRELTSAGVTRATEYSHDDRGLLTEVRTEPAHPDPDIPETITLARSPEDGQVSAIARHAPGQPTRSVTIDHGDGERVFPVRVSNELNHTSSFIYHPAYGTVGVELDANGVQIRRVYDDLGRLRAVIPGGGAKVTFAYEPAVDRTYAGKVAGTKITAREDTGSESFVEYDLWERPVLRAHRGFDGEWIHRVSNTTDVAISLWKRGPAWALPPMLGRRIGTTALIACWKCTALTAPASNRNIRSTRVTPGMPKITRATSFATLTIGSCERFEWTVEGETFSVQMLHDALGRLSSLVYPEVPGQPRMTVRNSYNATGYLAEIADVSGASTRRLWRVDARNLDDAPARGTYGNGLVTEGIYDDASGRLHKLNAGAVYSLIYGYEDIGLIESRTDLVAGRRERFAYDALHRLRSWRLDSKAGTRKTEYGFDDLGNLMRVLVNGQPTEENQFGGPGAGPHALTASTLHGSFAYDARGRRTDGHGQRIEYTELNLPREIATPNGVTAFGYDASGTRVKKTGPAGTILSIGGLYERRTDPHGGKKHVFYIQSSEETVAQVIYDESSGKTETQYILTDALGSTAVVTDEAGQEIERRYFEPFGQRIDESGAPISGVATDVRLGFTGHRQDDELGLIDMRGRMYDPATRRFLTPDPVISLPLFGQNYNGYAYSLNNPINVVDPSGFQPLWFDIYWGLIPPSQCGNVPSWVYEPRGFGLPSGPLDGFGGKPTAGGGSSATSGRWRDPNDPSSWTGTSSLTYADIWSMSLPSAPGPTAGVPNADLVVRSGSEQVRDFLRLRYAEDYGPFEAYTELNQLTEFFRDRLLPLALDSA